MIFVKVIVKWQWKPMNDMYVCTILCSIELLAHYYLHTQLLMFEACCNKIECWSLLRSTILFSKLSCNWHIHLYNRAYAQGVTYNWCKYLIFGYFIVYIILTWVEKARALHGNFTNDAVLASLIQIYSLVQQTNWDVY